MSPIDHSLEKLLAAASRSRPEPPEPPPFGFEAAFIARWRNARKEDESAWVFWLFKRATFFAIVVMTLSGAWSYFGSQSDVETTALARYAMMQFPP